MSLTQSGIAIESLEFCEDSEEYTVTYDQQATEPSMAVVGSVSNVLDTDPLELDPLFETIEADALDKLLRDAGDGPVEVSFTFAGCEVTMSGDGQIRLSTPDA